MFQISEDNLLPKYVCTDCWTVVLNFHEFFQTVEKAEIIFLQTKLKYGKIREKIQNKYQTINLINSTKRENTNSSISKSNIEPDESSNDSDNYLLTQMCSDDGNGSDSGEQEENCEQFGKRKISMSSESDFQNDSYGEKNTGAEPIPRDKDKEDKLINNYFNLTCKICSDKFDLVMELHKHCRTVHKVPLQLLTCKCGRNYKRPYEMRDHVYYHLNPNAFQ